MTTVKKNLQTINSGEGVEKRESFCTVGENVNWYSHYREQYRAFLKNEKSSTYYPAIPLLGIYLEKSIIQKDNTNTCRLPLWSNC